MFRVIVPCLRLRKLIAYPARGHALYNRHEAMAILQRFYDRAPWKEGDERECWAESENERFTLAVPSEV